jgi:DNA-binding NarL/FixJ family response regulator
MMDPVSEIVPSSAIQVFLIMENRLLREALIRLLRKRFDVVVIGYEGPINPTACEVRDTQFDVLLIDSFQTMRSAANNVRGSGIQPDYKVLLIGMEPDEKLFLTAIRSGVMGYLLKDASASDLVCAVRAVYQGDAVCPPQLCSALFRFVARSIEEIPAKRRVPKPDLTLRQQQLMALVAKGLTNKEIALSLHLSEFTVRNHIHRILKQVDAGSRTAAVEAIRSQSARSTLDGQAISSGKSKIHSGLGPHLLAASAGDKQQEHRFVVLDQGPDKFNLEIK